VNATALGITQEEEESVEKLSTKVVSHPELGKVEPPKESQTESLI